MFVYTCGLVFTGSEVSRGPQLQEQHANTLAHTQTADDSPHSQSHSFCPLIGLETAQPCFTATYKR